MKMRCLLNTLLVFLPMITSISSLHADEEKGREMEMQDRSRRLLLNRGTQSIEWSLHSDTLLPDQVMSGYILLGELRRNMELFERYSGLDNDSLQSKLTDLIDDTRYQVRTMNPKERADYPLY